MSITPSDPKIEIINKREYYRIPPIISMLKETPLLENYGGDARGIVDELAIPAGEYLYATHSKTKGYTVRTGENIIKSASLYVSKKWMHKHFGNCFGKGGDKIKGDRSDKKGVIHKHETKNNTEAMPTEKRTVPKEFILDEENKFRDGTGEIINLRTFGECTEKGIYFMASDVGEKFDIKDIVSRITRKQKDETLRHFIRGVDYDIFKTRIDGILQERVFLTYAGIVIVLFTSRSKKVISFRSWASKTLFTAHLGSDEEKMELGSKLVKTTPNVIKAFLGGACTAYSCVYFFKVGTCKSLRKKMKLPDTIPDDYWIAKFGNTNNLKRRTGEHESEYGKDITLEYYTYIDAEYLFEAERELKEYFKTIETNVDFGGKRELVAINPLHGKIIEKLYKTLGHKYGSNVTNVVKELSDSKKKYEYDMERQKNVHEKDIAEKELVHASIVAEKDKEIYQRDMAICQLKMEINMMKKDMEILMLKNQYGLKHIEKNISGSN